MRGGAALLVLALVLPELAACGPAPAAPKQQQQQRRPAGPDLPRVMSLNPCTDAMLVELAAPQQIVALSDYSRDQAQSSMDVARARQFASTGGTLEEVVAARPDRVVSGNFTPPATRAAMARLGIGLSEFAMPATVEDSVAQVRAMAAMLGQRAKGEALVARIEAAVAQARPAAGSHVYSALVWHGGGPGGGLVAGPHTLISDLLGRAGFAPLSATRRLGQSQFLPLENVLADPPEVVFAVGREASGGHIGRARALDHPALAQVAGMARFGLEPRLEYCGGTTIIAALGRLVQIRRSLP